MNNFHEKKLQNSRLMLRGARGSPEYILQTALVALNKYLEGLLEDHGGCADSISDAEIEGAFEMVTQHLFPYSADEMEQIMALAEAREQSEAGV